MNNKHKSYADDGWAIWLDGNDITTVYLNDWLNPQGNSYVDMAIHIRGIRSATTLYVYIPFVVSENELDDVSLRMQDRRLLGSLFGTGCVIDYLKNDYTSELAYGGRTLDLIHISRCSYTMRPLASGTIMIVNLQELQEHLANDEAYFRFRVPHKSLDVLFRRQVNVGGIITRIRDLITSPVVSENYGYSIRINETRLLPVEICRIGAFNRQNLRKTGITLSLSDAYEVSDANCYRIRRLEEDLYRDFVPAGFSCEDVITYQWNESWDDHPKGYYNYFLTIKRETIGRMSMLVYMILILLIGAGGNAVWTVIAYLLGI